MIDAQVSNALSDAKVLKERYKNMVAEMLIGISNYKKMEIENADIKEDIETIINDIEKNLQELQEDINSIG